MQKPWVADVDKNKSKIKKKKKSTNNKEWNEQVLEK